MDGTPADSVLAGLLHIMKSDPPDLVLSGANFGQNVGYAINSGTVGAATVAMYSGYPAIAISVGVDYSEAGVEPIPFPSTFKAFKGAAEMTVQLIADLQKSSGNSARLLPQHTLLNVNYPALESEEIKGIWVLPAARSGGVTFDYEEAGDTGQLKVKIQAVVPGEDQTDWAMFARGFVTISVLDGDWDAGAAIRGDISARLSDIEQQ